MTDYKINKIKKYLEECINLSNNGVCYGIELIAYNINSILDSNDEKPVMVGSFLDIREI